jgi:SAM-dependent methyltransferase
VRQFPIYPWGVSFLQEAVTKEELGRELQARDREAVIYEQNQVLLKKRSFVDLQCRLILKRLSRAPWGGVLDAGSGTGMITEALSKTGRPIAAVDFSKESLICLCEKRVGNAVAVHANLTELPFPDQSFAAVVCSLVIQHMPPDARQTALREFFRCLAPSGMLIATAFNRASFLQRQLEPVGRFDSGIPYYSFSHEELEGAAKSTGFEDVAVGPLGIGLYFAHRRGGWRIYQRLHSWVNRVEGTLNPHLRPNRAYSSQYWLLTARKAAGNR